MIQNRLIKTAITVIGLGIASLALCGAGSNTKPSRLLLEGRATVFAPGDGASGATVGCPGAALRGHGTSGFRALLAAGVPVVATRYKGKLRPRCGERVVVESVRTGLRTEAVKLCVGPFGMCVESAAAPPGRGHPHGKCRTNELRVVARGADPYGEREQLSGRWISDVDLTPAVCAAIACDGWDRVRLYAVE